MGPTLPTECDSAFSASARDLVASALACGGVLELVGCVKAKRAKELGRGSGDGASIRIGIVNEGKYLVASAACYLADQGLPSTNGGVGVAFQGGGVIVRHCTRTCVSFGIVAC